MRIVASTIVLIAASLYSQAAESFEITVDGNAKTLLRDLSVVAEKIGATQLNMGTMPQRVLSDPVWPVSLADTKVRVNVVYNPQTKSLSLATSQATLLAHLAAPILNNTVCKAIQCALKRHYQSLLIKKPPKTQTIHPGALWQSRAPLSGRKWTKGNRGIKLIRRYPVKGYLHHGI